MLNNLINKGEIVISTITISFPKSRPIIVHIYFFLKSILFGRYSNVLRKCPIQVIKNCWEATDGTIKIEKISKEQRYEN